MVCSVPVWIFVCRWQEAGSASSTTTCPDKTCSKPPYKPCTTESECNGTTEGTCEPVTYCKQEDMQINVADSNGAPTDVTLRSGQRVCIGGDVPGTDCTAAPHDQCKGGGTCSNSGCNVATGDGCAGTCAGTPPCSANVDENSPAGTVIAKLGTVDPDTCSPLFGPKAGFNYELDLGFGDNRYFALSGCNGWSSNCDLVTSAEGLDYEAFINSAGTCCFIENVHVFGFAMVSMRPF